MLLGGHSRPLFMYASRYMRAVKRAYLASLYTNLFTAQESRHDNLPLMYPGWKAWACRLHRRSPPLQSIRRTAQRQISFVATRGDVPRFAPVVYLANELHPNSAKW